MTTLDPRLTAALNAAANARQAGNAAEELRQLDAAFAIAPDDPRAANARGMRALADGDAELARRCFATATAADPGEPALWMNLATANRQIGDDDGEAAALDRALSIDRLHFMATLRMAELNERRGRLADAAQGWSGVVQMALALPERPPRVADALARGQAFLAAHNAQLADRLDAELSAELAAMGQAARRFNACIDHVLGRRAIYTNQCHGIHYPFLPADEFFDRAMFPWLDQIEARTDAIRAEALALLSEGGADIRPYVRQDAGTPENKWSALDHSLDWSACFLWEYGVRNEAVCARCPETAAALDALPRNHIPGKAPSAFFSILAPGAHIPAHTGVTNTRAIIHLPVVVPAGCRFRVGGETRDWREGEAFAFDDTIEHEAWNDSAERRIVLIFDVWNPHLTPQEQALLQRFYAISDARG
ncbi:MULTISPECIES: aspartyl/asparaginyl beta-hydroxylase domain-containing protein [unclassified Sphingomonas]|uniref:aspartyl/asparaginyl beta-hydroxylase domain-containing protein n=1 Tax=unclassified Sphingomonas TaxID=196159 RepID=UPI00083639D3|nr:MULTISPECIES: aspartyl/asparaginyl beta-hydroxylase domain-containing protein [unclassified Sphingomonas]